MRLKTHAGTRPALVEFRHDAPGREPSQRDGSERVGCALEVPLTPLASVAGAVTECALDGFPRGA